MWSLRNSAVIGSIVGLALAAVLMFVPVESRGDVGLFKYEGGALFFICALAGAFWFTVVAWVRNRARGAA